MAFIGKVVLLIDLLIVVRVLSDNCVIPWMETGHEVAESEYVLDLSIVNTTGHLRSYFPDTQYDITIRSKFRNQTFTQFYFTMSNKNKTMSDGRLTLREVQLSMFHNDMPFCINRVIDGPISLAKQTLKIGWQSPPRDSGCIELKAAIKETDLRYHVANLTVCQDPRVELDDPGQILRNCCACDEGKYELAFEGLWSRYTHPKNFPRREWLAVFPTIIGASHSHDYEFWHPYTNASDGLKKYAENGETTDLELELKANMANITTLLKFRGVNFQNKTRQSYAGVRVTRDHHVVSLVARIEPSPDWFIGVSSLELCQPDCTWAKQKTLNLYAYDVGVRDGTGYENQGDFTDPADIINSMNMTWPPPVWKDDALVESPFYDKTNNTHDVRPLAKIHFTRRAGSEKSCKKVGATHYMEPDCVNPWSAWDPCSVTCGIGVERRNRTLKKNVKEEDCPVELKQSRTCNIKQVPCKKELTLGDCVLTEWSEWTKCLDMCGQESRHRSRTYKWTQNAVQCIETFGQKVLQQEIDCGHPPCPDDRPVCMDHLYTDWQLTPCSATVGEGFRIKYRTLKPNPNNLLGTETDYPACRYQEVECTVHLPRSHDVVPDHQDKDEEAESPKIPQVDYPLPEIPITEDHCSMPADIGQCEDGHNENSLRHYYRMDRDDCAIFSYTGCGGNKNNFKTKKECMRECSPEAKDVNCVMSPWSEWSECKSCDGVQYRQMTIIVPPRNNGRACPLDTVEKRKCTEKCARNAYPNQEGYD
ncbi:hypothetical protein TSAR_003613 [Trichomalopsis sarcophagae]|uniref:Uncharacterized protein n=1 Tax=Trichomalopsis sarcophagae TaxID=543379 RepID=A0A232F855_9HYME|nr:hypothetical protein TSAR_003613 [Trichomalopsis sarcophagae]